MSFNKTCLFYPILGRIPYKALREIDYVFLKYLEFRSRTPLHRGLPMEDVDTLSYRSHSALRSPIQLKVAIRVSVVWQVPRDKSSVQLDLPLPLTCSNIMIEFAEFHTDPSKTDDAAAVTGGIGGGLGGIGGGGGRRGHGAGGILHCPRCGRPVTDIHGVCRQCGEVAFQCCQV